MSGCDILVTGARGFVGRHVIERAHAAGLIARPSGVDLLDPAATAAELAEAQPRAVIHLAAAPRRGRSASWSAIAGDVAMAGSIIAALRAHAPAAPALMVGSAAQYGMGLQRPLREDDPTSPVTAYGAAKCVLECAVTLTPLRESVRVIWTRSFNHIGPGQGLDSPAAQWAQQVVEAEQGGRCVVRTGNLDAIRDFLDVRDIADAYLALVRSPAEGIVNVCSGVATPMRELAAAVVATTKTPITIDHDPALDRSADPPYVVGDPSRLLSLTGWTPRIPIEASANDLVSAGRSRAILPS